MTHPTPSPSQTLIADNGSIGIERRRPGRIKAADAELIPLMRKPDLVMELPPEPLATWDAWEPKDPLQPSRGIALGVVLSLPIWAAIGGVLYQLAK